LKAVPTWKLIVEYDGTDFCGWQRQPNGPTVQETLEKALEQLHSGDPIRATAAGRTDAGVHARGQAVSVTTPRVLVQNSYERGVNTFLPPTIAVRHVAPVPDGFDARRWARGKRYAYRILRSRFRSPLRDRFTWQVHSPLNLQAMREAATVLVGRHDFSSFRASNCEAQTTIREMRRVQLHEEGEELVLTFEATAFLKNMVRSLTGTLVEVGMGRRPPDSMAALLRASDRTAAGPTAPPQGLSLEEVFYDPAGPPQREVLTDADD
jgi:tRNA pseudouridine38-40 synthase